MGQVNEYQFNEYCKDPQSFPFLGPLQDHWEDIRNEFTAFMGQASEEERAIASLMMGPQSQTIKTKKGKKYSAFGVLFQGAWIEEYIRTYHLSYPGYDDTEAVTHVSELRHTYFPTLSQVIQTVNETHDVILRNVYFGTFHPGLDIKLHTNDNPHMYRGYLGLIVPQGDVAMQICHDILHWYEGEFMVLDHSYPHCPHNYTTQNRTVLVVDFFKPDKPRTEVVEFEQAQVAQRMKDHPYSLGVFGQSDHAREEDFIKYGLAHQLEWEQTLNKK